jgi:SPP1 family predicted phage head-tail adaptor
MAGGIEAGRLRDKIVLLRPEYAKDEYGQDLIHWGRVGPVFAEVVGNGGGTSLSVGRSSITYSHTVRIRKSSVTKGVLADWRLEWKDRIFQISSVVDQNNDSAILELDCNDELLSSETPVIADQNAILFDSDIHDVIGNDAAPHSPINRE